MAIQIALSHEQSQRLDLYSACTPNYKYMDLWNTEIPRRYC
jgi:hypothetical protein